MNIYQAALKLRLDYEGSGIMLEATEDKITNLYFVFHDALHTYLNAAPVVEEEPLVLAAELVLGGQEYSNNKMLQEVSADDISSSLSKIPADILEILIDFYTQRFS